MKRVGLVTGVYTTNSWIRTSKLRPCRSIDKVVSHGVLVGCRIVLSSRPGLFVSAIQLGKERTQCHQEATLHRLFKTSTNNINNVTSKPWQTFQKKIQLAYLCAVRLSSHHRPLPSSRFLSWSCRSRGSRKGSRRNVSFAE